MCGRVSTYNKVSIYEIMRMYSDSVIENFDSRYNVAPGANLAAIYRQDENRMAAMHWGLIPLWAKPETFSRPLINARAETIFEKPSFRSLVKQHRCVIPVNGFYEWNRKGDKKIPNYFLPAESDAMLLGAIYQFNKQGVAECCLITTVANAVMQPVHHRMPVIIENDNVEDWLESDDRKILEALMRPASDGMLMTYEVSSYVSNAKNDGERCIAAVA